MTDTERSGPREEAAITRNTADLTVPHQVERVFVVEPISSVVAS